MRAKVNFFPRLNWFDFRLAKVFILYHFLLWPEDAEFAEPDMEG